MNKPLLYIWKWGMISFFFLAILQMTHSLCKWGQHRSCYINIFCHLHLAKRYFCWEESTSTQQECWWPRKVCERGWGWVLDSFFLNFLLLFLPPLRLILLASEAPRVCDSAAVLDNRKMGWRDNVRRCGASKNRRLIASIWDFNL